MPNLPDNIEWQNMGITDQGRYFRKFLGNILALVLILMAFLAIIGITYNKDMYYSDRHKMIPSFDCPKDLTKKIAYEDYWRGEESQGFMHCLCFDRYVKKL
jgi:hypothetical protein